MKLIVKTLLEINGSSANNKKEYVFQSEVKDSPILFSINVESEEQLKQVLLFLEKNRHFLKNE